MKEVKKIEKCKKKLIYVVCLFCVIICSLLCLSCEGEPKSKPSGGVAANGSIILASPNEYVIGVVEVEIVQDSNSGVYGSVIGPIVFIRLDDLDSDWEPGVRSKVTGGSWYTECGEMKDGHCYYYNPHMKRIVELGPVPEKYNDFHLDGNWTAQSCCSLILNDIISCDANDEDTINYKLRQNVKNLYPR